LLDSLLQETQMYRTDFILHLQTAFFVVQIFIGCDNGSVEEKNDANKNIHHLHNMNLTLGREILSSDSTLVTVSFSVEGDGRQNQTFWSSEETTTNNYGRYAIDKVIMKNYDKQDDYSNNKYDNGVPIFDLVQTKDVVNVVGGVAKLKCTVHNLGDKTVSWIRLSDTSLLTVGGYTYTSDLRLESKHEPGSPHWYLIIRNVSLVDDGQYECQVSTTPHMSTTISLQIKEAKVQVLGGPDMYVDTGSVINLTCSIWWTPSPPEVTLWHHNSSLISHRGPRPGVSLIIDKADVTTVQLLIMSARYNDSGVYTCLPDNAPATNVTLHVLTGDKTAKLSDGIGVRLDLEIIAVSLVINFIKDFSQPNI